MIPHLLPVTKRRIVSEPKRRQERKRGRTTHKHDDERAPDRRTLPAPPLDHAAGSQAPDEPADRVRARDGAERGVRHVDAARKPEGGVRRARVGVRGIADDGLGGRVESGDVEAVLELREGERERQLMMRA